MACDSLPIQHRCSGKRALFLLLGVQCTVPPRPRPHNSCVAVGGVCVSKGRGVIRVKANEKEEERRRTVLVQEQERDLENVRERTNVRYRLRDPANGGGGYCSKLLSGGRECLQDLTVCSKQAKQRSELCSETTGSSRAPRPKEPTDAEAASHPLAQ
jgi:hypothetical protein